MNGKGKRIAAALLILAVAAALFVLPRSGHYLTLRNQDTGELYARYRMAEGERFSVTFEHSVNRYLLTDTYEICGGTIYVEETEYGAFGAGVQTELNPGEVLSYTDDGNMLISNIHQERSNLCYIVGTVYDHVLTLGGEEISLRDLCGRSAPVRFGYEYFLI